MYFNVLSDLLFRKLRILLHMFNYLHWFYYDKQVKFILQNIPDPLIHVT